MNNAQRIGNKNKAASITDPAYLSAKKSMEETFKAVLFLKPDATLFPWTSVSKIMAGPLEDAINNIKINAKRLPTPPSPETISTLIAASRSFQQARKAYRNKTYRESSQQR